MQNIVHTKNPGGRREREEGPHQNHAKVQSRVDAGTKKLENKNNKNVSFVFCSIMGVAKIGLLFFYVPL